MCIAQIAVRVSLVCAINKSCLMAHRGLHAPLATPFPAVFFIVLHRYQHSAMGGTPTALRTVSSVCYSGTLRAILSVFITLFLWFLNKKSVPLSVKTDKQMKFKPSYKQLAIDAFRSSLDGLDKSNRRVWLDDHLTWEVYENQYGQKLNNQNAGACAKPARMVIAAIVIKHATHLSDNIHINKANRAILKDLQVRNNSRLLGRPPKESPSPEGQAAMARAAGQRNEIECSFGTGKRVYHANDIRAKLPETAECWTGMCFFVKNVMKFFGELCHFLIGLLDFFTLAAAWGAGSNQPSGLRPINQ